MNKRRHAHISPAQKEILVSFIENHPEVKRGRFNTKFSHVDAARLWEKCAIKLNAVPGAVKSWKYWRKTWHDIRCTVLNKSRQIQEELPSAKNILSPLETRISQLIGEKGTKAEANKKLKFINYSNSNKDIDFKLSPNSCNEIKHSSEAQFNEEQLFNLIDFPEEFQPEMKTSHSFLIEANNNNNKIAMPPMVEINAPKFPFRNEETNDKTEDFLLLESNIQRMEVNNIFEGHISTKKTHVRKTTDQTQKIFEKAIRKLIRQDNRKSNFMTEYYQKKLEILERSAVAKERIANELEILNQTRIKNTIF